MEAGRPRIFESSRIALVGVDVAEVYCRDEAVLKPGVKSHTICSFYGYNRRAINKEKGRNLYGILP
jgi:hypothetical protein